MILGEVVSIDFELPGGSRAMLTLVYLSLYLSLKVFSHLVRWSHPNTLGARYCMVGVGNAYRDIMHQYLEIPLWEKSALLAFLEDGGIPKHSCIIHLPRPLNIIVTLLQCNIKVSTIFSH